MNRQSVQKLALFLKGLENRVVENKDFFRKITAAYKSGLKTYTASIVLEGGKLKMNFIGNTEVFEAGQLSERLSKFAGDYESVIITYEERGTTIYIEADSKNVTMSTRQAEEENTAKSHQDTSRMASRNYYIKPGQANDELLKEIGILGKEGRIKNDMIRKYNQIDHFVELIHDMLVSLAEKHDSITVVDCGCGKSYLSFVLNYYIKEVLKKPCYFIGLDYSGDVIDASKRMANNLGYHNMEFKLTDIGSYSADREIHLAISLHACDTATDAAIALAVRNNVKAIVAVPCCHREVLSQYTYPAFQQILKYGILKARMADVVTDGIRALLLEAMGYKVSIIEYISPLETPKNLMIRAEKLCACNKESLEGYKELKQLLGITPALEKFLNSFI